MSFILLGILNSQVTGGGAAPAMELISSTILNSDTASVTFSSIPADYKHLQIRAVAKSNQASGWDRLQFAINGNTTNSNYTWHYLRGSGSSVGSGFSNLRLNSSIAGDNASTGNFGAAVIDVLDYANTSKTTTLRSLGGHTESTPYISLTSNLFISSSAVTSFQLLPQFGTAFKRYSRFSLYGVKG